jgi:hypothetical protein
MRATARDAEIPIARAVAEEVERPAHRDQTPTSTTWPARTSPGGESGSAKAVQPSIAIEPAAPIKPVSLPTPPRSATHARRSPIRSDPATRGDAHSAGHHAQATAAVTPTSTAARSVSGTVAQIPPMVATNANAPTQPGRSWRIPYEAKRAARTATAICHNGVDAPLGPDPRAPRNRPVATKAMITAAPQTSPQSAVRLRHA